MKNTLSMVFVILVLQVGAGAQTVSRNNLIATDSKTGDKRPATVQPEAPADFVIGPEDVLSIVVWHEPDLTNKATVRPDGKIGLPLLNDVQASDLTPRQLQERI